MLARKQTSEEGRTLQLVQYVRQSLKRWKKESIEEWKDGERSRDSRKEEGGRQGGYR